MVTIWRVVGGLALSVLALATFNRATTFQSDVSVWAAAVAVSPLKPRPWFNWAAAAAERGDFPQARARYARVLLVATQPHLSPYTRAISRMGALANVARLDAIEGVDSGAAASLAEEFPAWRGF